MSGSLLFASRADRLFADDALTRRLALAIDQIHHGAVVPTFDPVIFHNQLAEFTFDTPRPLLDVLDWTIVQMGHGLVHVNHPRYFGLFNPTPTFPSECADRIAAAFNPQLATATTSPAAVAIETHVIAGFIARAGLPVEARGHFTTGGSEANYTAALLALTKRNPGFAEHGARAFSGQPVFYVSADSHLAWVKIAHQAGIGRAAVRLIKTDGQGRMDTEALSDQLRGDEDNGLVPFMIVATAGTTNAGMIDPLMRCATIAQSWNLWFHVDAAWGGGLLACEDGQDRLAGIELADSITIDAHKWFATTMGCGMFLTRWGDWLPACFDVATSYMPSHTISVDPYVNSMQWSRRFLGLRLFLSLTIAGWKGFADHVNHSLGLIVELRQELMSRGWMIVNNSPLGVACMVPPQGSADPAAIVKQVLGTGRAWVSTAVFEGQQVIRACVTSGLTTRRDITVLVNSLVEAAKT